MKRLFVAVLLILCVSAAAAQVPADVPSGHWAYDAVRALVDKGYVAGYTDGKFLGDRTLTRYEFATVVKRIIDGLDAKAAAVQEPSAASVTNPPAHAPSVSQDDLAAISKLVDEFKAELLVIGARLDKVEANLATLTATVNKVNSIVTDPDGALETAKTDLGKLKKVTISGYVQSRYQTINPTDEAASEGTYKDTFFVRRARVKVTAKPSSRSVAVLQFDVGQDTFTEKDAYFQYNFKGDDLIGPSFYVGQMNWPFGYDVPTSSSVRECPERALITRRLFPGERDQGAKITGPISSSLYWQLGLYNGTGTQSSSSQDQNDRKDIIANLKSKIGDLDLGASYYGGAGVWTAFNTNTPAAPYQFWVNKSRYGLDLQYYTNNLILKAEYFKGRGVDAAARSWDQSDFVTGGYATAIYSIDRDNQFVARYSTVSTDPVNPQFERVNTWDLGVVHWLDHSSRVKLFYLINNEEASAIDNNGYVAEWIVKY